MTTIYINPYSVEGGLSIAYQIAKTADAFFDWKVMGHCAIICEHKDAPVIIELLKENKLECNYNLKGIK